MTEDEIKRINELSRKSRGEGLTEQEKEEQRLLREKYLEDFRKNLRGTLDNTYIQYPNGEKVPFLKENRKKN